MVVLQTKICGQKPVLFALRRDCSALHFHRPIFPFGPHGHHAIFPLGRDRFLNPEVIETNRS